MKGERVRCCRCKRRIARRGDRGACQAYVSLRACGACGKHRGKQGMLESPTKRMLVLGEGVSLALDVL